MMLSSFLLGKLVLDQLGKGDFSQYVYVSSLLSGLVVFNIALENVLFRKRAIVFNNLLIFTILKIIVFAILFLFVSYISGFSNSVIAWYLFISFLSELLFSPFVVRFTVNRQEGRLLLIQFSRSILKIAVVILIYVNLVDYLALLLAEMMVIIIMGLVYKQHTTMEFKLSDIFRELKDVGLYLHGNSSVFGLLLRLDFLLLPIIVGDSMSHAEYAAAIMFTGFQVTFWLMITTQFTVNIRAMEIHSLGTMERKFRLFLLPFWLLTTISICFLSQFYLGSDLFVSFLPFYILLSASQFVLRYVVGITQLKWLVHGDQKMFFLKATLPLLCFSIVLYVLIGRFGAIWLAGSNILVYLIISGWIRVVTKKLLTT